MEEVQKSIWAVSKLYEFIIKGYVFMKPFMLRHKLGWLPNKLEYRRTYIIGFKGETDES
ncbi:hypothetical protein NY607_09375 [Lysinibacillus sp. A4]|uniref:hypothetical protein n=1 Tax=Lysinibacillus TaxID=400634 RepID=UPI000A6C3B0B|nr:MULTISPECIES: hypothetical protein [Lysinibacillus]MCS5501327.1 hypothetical protein [Lysinibacillus sp. A4]